MTRPSGRSTQWIYYLTASFMFGAVFLRTLLVYGGRPEFRSILLLLAVWFALWAVEPAVSGRWSAYFSLYLVVQTAAVFLLLTMPGANDFFAALLMILSMQVMLRLRPRIGALWIAFCAVLMVPFLARSQGAEALALALVFTGANILVGSYALATRRAEEARIGNLALAQELQDGNRQLTAYAAQLAGLAAARERNRLARELHDSVTQTVFSMNLATQSARLLFERDPQRARPQLERVSQLAHSALGEMQLLISELKPETVAEGGLPAALGRLVADGRFPEGLVVSLSVEGEGRLSPAEAQGLARIAQEALNNVAKHARASQATVRLHLAEPMWLEIADQGQGFDPGRAHDGSQVGLVSMQERAAEIGWQLEITTGPGEGTRVRVEKQPESEEQR